MPRGVAIRQPPRHVTAVGFTLTAVNVYKFKGRAAMLPRRFLFGLFGVPFGDFQIAAPALVGYAVVMPLCPGGYGRRRRYRRLGDGFVFAAVGRQPGGM